METNTTNNINFEIDKNATIHFVLSKDKRKADANIINKDMLITILWTIIFLDLSAKLPIKGGNTTDTI